IGPLLRDEWGRRLTRDRAQQIIDTVARSCAITTRYTPHAFRHAWTTLALDAGCSVRDIMAGGGWADASMIHYYDRSRSGVERNATHQLTDWLTNNSDATLHPEDRDMLEWHRTLPPI
ncbi:MAG TPA: tyrosine-type recombinase/integrase, partial [Ilumatobacteraceae bacterium]|nr:tyrosine-type recombinase/integrase [Ilumatobacteraceae bacterium]